MQVNLVIRVTHEHSANRHDRVRLFVRIFKRKETVINTKVITTHWKKNERGKVGQKYAQSRETGVWRRPVHMNLSLVLSIHIRRFTRLKFTAFIIDIISLYVMIVEIGVVVPLLSEYVHPRTAVNKCQVVRS